jgi:Mitochondrial carrier protein
VTEIQAAHIAADIITCAIVFGVSHLNRIEGTRGLFRGLGPSLVRAFPLHAIVFCGYELTMELLLDEQQHVLSPQCVVVDKL